MSLISESDKEELKKIFENNLKDEVEILVFLDYEKNKEQSEIAKQLFNELLKISNKLKFKFYDSRTEEGKKLIEKFNLNLDKYGKRKGPIIIFKKKPNIIYFGLPAGQEFTSFLEDIIAISNNNIEIDLKAAKIISKINIPLDILVFVTPPCPYCPIMTSAAHKFAFLNPKIRGIMIMAPDFPELSNAYNVYAVPKNVIKYNDRDLLMWEGALPEHLFAERISHAIEHIK